MIKFFQSIFLCITIWVLTALINTAIGGSYLLMASNANYPWPGNYPLVFGFTLFFSIPAMFFFWIALLANWSVDNLFRFMLKAGFILSALFSTLLYFLPTDLPKSQVFIMTICIVSASIASIMIHHSVIQSISNKQKTIDYA